MTDVERQERELNRYWNELLTPGMEPNARGVYDDAVATLRHLSRMTQAPLPGDALLRVDQGVQLYPNLACDSVPLDGIDTLGGEWWAPHPWSKPASPVRGDRDAPSRIAAGTFLGRGGVTRLTHLVATLLLLTTLGGMFVWLAPHGELVIPSAVLPAIPGMSEGESLLALTLPAEAIPHGERVSVLFDDFSLGAEEVSRWDPDERCCPGLWLIVMAEGSLAMRSAGPANVLRSQTRLTPTTLADGEEVEIGPGDAFLARYDVPFDARNAGAGEARFLTVTIIDGYEPLDGAPPEWTWHPDGATSYGLNMPDGPAALSLRKVVLDAGAALPPPPDAYIELGLTMADNEPLTSNDTSEILNPGNKPVTVHVLTLGPAG